MAVFNTRGAQAGSSGRLSDASSSLHNVRGKPFLEGAGRLFDANTSLHNVRGYGPPIIPPPDPPFVDVVAPSVFDVSPPGLADLTPDTQVFFSVTDETGLLCVFVYVIYPETGDVEVIHDGVNFMPRFLTTSTRVTITNGFRFSVRRKGGWKLSSGATVPDIDIRVRALDAAGNEAS